MPRAETWTMHLLPLAAGAALIVAGLRDLVHVLFHPAGSGILSRGIMRALWRVLRRIAARRPRVLAIAGPAIFLSVVTTWTALLALGWAFVFWPFLPHGFRFASGLDAAAGGGFEDALYVSLVSLATLGFGDVTPTLPWLRVAATLEAGVGFVLLTAGISWILSLYPVLRRRRAFAHDLALARAAHEHHDVAPDALPSSEAGALLSRWTERLTAIRADLVQSPISYYFHDPSDDASLPALLPYARVIAAASQGAERPPSVRFHGARLERAVGDYLQEIGASFLPTRQRPGDDAQALLEGYAADHCRKPVSPAC